jgi:hypothetical protein
MRREERRRWKTKRESWEKWIDELNLKWDKVWEWIFDVIKFEFQKRVGIKKRATKWKV